MGDNFLKWQQEQFERGRDLAIEESERPRFFIRPEIISTIYTVLPVSDETLHCGENLLAKVEREEKRVILLRGHRIVGQIEGDGAERLLQELSQDGGPEVIPIKVNEVAELSGVASVQIDEGIIACEDQDREVGDENRQTGPR